MVFIGCVDIVTYGIMLVESFAQTAKLEIGNQKIRLNVWTILLIVNLRVMDND
jgi:hypothetical protein